MIKKIIALLIVVLLQFVFFIPQNVHAATSPTLNALSGYSVLGGAAVTCTGATTTTGAVGVSPGTSITGFPSPCTAGGGTQSNNASAIAAQAEALSTFSALDQTCDQSFGAVDLTATFPTGVGPGVYCSTSSFTLTGNLNLTGSGVWIFKSVSTIITSPGSSVTGGDSCNVWWRVGSSATLDTTTSFKGNLLALNGTTALNAGATVDGRIIGLSANTVTLDSNTISGPTCAGGGSGSSSSSASSDSDSTSLASCPILNFVSPIILETRKIDADSIFISWGPYSGTNTFIVQYGFENGNLPYSTNVTGFSTIINSLPENQPVFVRVAATNSCSVGNYGAAVLAGATSRIYSPLLPNTGINGEMGWTVESALNAVIVLLVLTMPVVYFRRRAI